jgi:ribosomal protein S18 acetylase RimI-like enzyme
MVDSDLGTFKDKAGIDLKIKYCAAIGGTECMTFYLNQFVKLLASGFTHPHIPGHNKCKSLYATDNGKIVGQIVFEVQEDYCKTTWIYLSSVDENYRNRGIYNMLHKNLEQLMPQLGSRKVASFVHVDNLVRQASCKKVGMKPVYYKMEKEI